MPQAWRDQEPSAKELVVSILRDTRTRVLEASMTALQAAKDRALVCKCGRDHGETIAVIEKIALAESKSREDALDAAIELLTK